MQRLKRLPLLKRLASSAQNLIGSVSNRLENLQPFGKLATIVWIAVLILLLIVLCGCSPRTVKPSLPAQAQAREMPTYDGQTYRDAILYLIEVREWGMSCESDKAAIRSVFKNED